MSKESFTKRAARYVINNSPLRLDYRLNKYLRNPHRDFPELWYKLIGFKPSGHVLDIGSGRRPFPPATVLADKYLEPCRHNTGYPIVPAGKNLINTDVEVLPFDNKEFDFVFCSHVLEHTEHPIKACSEIMRVGKRGYIETPRIGSDSLYSWGIDDVHRWLVHDIGNTLVFFEMRQELFEGLRSTAFRDLLSSPWRQPLAQAFHKNHEAFNVCFNWVDKFNVHVYHSDGSMEGI